MIGDNIRYYRKESKLTQRELAEKINVVSSVVAHWEQNKVLPSVPRLIRMCKALNVSADQILGIGIEKVNEDEEIKKKLFDGYRNHPENQNAVNMLLSLKK